MAESEVREKSFLQSFLEVFLQVTLLIFLLITPWFYGLTRFRDQLCSQCLVFSLFLLVVPLLDEKKEPRRDKNPFDAWVFLGLGIGFFYIFLSPLPYQSLLGFLRLLGCVVFYGLVRRAARTDAAIQVFLWVFLISGVFYSIYGLLQYYGFLPHAFWYQSFSLASRYVNGGHFAALLLFPLFIGISLLGSSRRVLSQGTLIVFLLILGWAVLLTRSRAVWIAFLIGLGIFVSLGKQNQILSRKGILGMAVLAGAGGLFFLSRGGFEEIWERFRELRGMRFYSLAYRWQLWQGALAALRARPWGWGLGMLSSVLPRYRVQADRFFIDYAHNEFLQVGVDLGIPGLLFFGGFLFFYLQKARLFIKKEGARDSEKMLAAGFLALWVSLALVSQVDFPLRIYATGILFAAFLGLSAYLLEPRKRESAFYFPKKVRMISWGFVFVANLVTARQLFAEFHFDQAKRLDKSFAWSRAQGEYEKAARLAPFYGPYQEILGSLYERKASIVFDRNEKENLSRRALRAYQEASRLQPYRASLHYFLASLYEQKGESLRAQSEFLKTMALEPTNGLYLSDYGYFALRHSLAAEAIEAFEKLKNLSFRGEAKSDFNEIVRLCYRLTQDYAELRRVIPDDVQGHSDLARLLGEKSRWDLSKKEFGEAIEKAKKISPDYKAYFENTGNRIADFYLSHRRLQEALEIYQEAAARIPGDPAVQKKLEELKLSE